MKVFYIFWASCPFKVSEFRPLTKRSFSILPKYTPAKSLVHYPALTSKPSLITLGYISTPLLPHLSNILKHSIQVLSQLSKFIGIQISKSSFSGFFYVISWNKTKSYLIFWIKSKKYSKNCRQPRVFVVIKLKTDITGVGKSAEKQLPKESK